MSLLLCGCSTVRSRYHTVQRGENIALIAVRYGIPVNPLLASNVDTVLHPGSKIFIPFEESPDWDLESESSDDSVTLPYESDPKVGHVRFRWPVRGKISSYFGRRRGDNHDGIDIVASQGTPVVAARSGHIIYAAQRISGYGNMVIVRHADQYASVYAHLLKLDVKRGQYVNRGQRIGRVGKTGRASSPHLHFEIRNNRLPVNPLLYLQDEVAINILKQDD